MISVVIPVFNEEIRLYKSLDNIRSYFKYSKFDYEIIVVDDGSVDNTVRLAESSREELDKNIYLTENRRNGEKVLVSRMAFCTQEDDIFCSRMQISQLLSISWKSS